MDIRQDYLQALALRVADQDVVAVEDGKVWERISMTFSFLAKSDAVWFTVTGESKRTALTKVLYQREDYEDLTWENALVVHCLVLCFHKKL